MRCKKLTEEQKENRRWLQKYNQTGQHGGDKMLAVKAGMTYTAWCNLPAMTRARKRNEILTEARR